MNDCIKPSYETISDNEKQELTELMQSSILNGFTQQEIDDVCNVFLRVCDRLGKVG